MTVGFLCPLFIPSQESDPLSNSVMSGVIEPFGNLYRIIVLGDAQNYIEKDPNCMGKSSMSDNNGTTPNRKKDDKRPLSGNGRNLSLFVADTRDKQRTAGHWKINRMQVTKSRALRLRASTFSAG